MPSGDITRLLAAVRDGDSQAESDLLSLVYEELRDLAGRLMKRERANHTLQPTALVHEGYVRLMHQQANTPQNRDHFFATAATVMRRVLVDYGRQHLATKRGGGRQRVELNDLLATTEPRIEEILIVDEMLTRMAEFAPREARVVEFIYFAGLTHKQDGAMLKPTVSERTAKRYIKNAQSWLKAELEKARE